MLTHLPMKAILNYPLELHNLITGISDYHKNFQTYTWNYNTALAFASFEANIVPPTNHRLYCFRLCGQVCHRVGTLRPDNHAIRKYGQLYVYNPDSAINFRMQHTEND